MVDQEQSLAFLSGLPDYQELDRSLLAALAGIAYLQKLDPGQFVFLEGDERSDLILVEEGWLKASKISEAGREQILHFLGPGETFNQSSLLSGGKTRVSLEVLERARIWVLPGEQLLPLMDRYPGLSWVLSRQLADQVDHLTHLISTLALQTVEARLAGIFLEHSQGEIMHRRSWSTQSEMAARLGTVPDVLNRALNKLADEGLIKIQRRQIQILDREGLQKKARQQG